MNKDEKTDSSWSALSLVWELGYLVSLPIIIFAFAGRFLDKKFDTSPWLLLIGILMSIIISSYIVYKKTVKIIDKY